MGRGRRFDQEPQLNLKKVIAVIIAVVVFIMLISIIKGLFSKDAGSEKIVSKTYFTVFNNNKWGVIDNSGKYVIDPSYEEMIVIPNNKIAAFVVTYDVNYETGEFKTKVLNEKNEEIFTGYDKIEPLSNLDKNKKLFYENDALRIQKNGKYGLINLLGKEILPAEYDEITAISQIENSFKIEKDGKFGIVNSEGKIIVEPQYADIDVYGDDDKSGFIVKNENGKFGLISYANTKILDIKYDSIQKVQGINKYVVTENGKQKLINNEMADILSGDFDQIKQILNESENAVIFTKTNKYGVMDFNKKTLINAEYDYLEEAGTGILIAKKGNSYGIINLNKEEKIPFNYTEITYNKKADIYFMQSSDVTTSILNGNLENKLTGILLEFNEKNGYIKVRNDDTVKYYNFKFEEKSEEDVFPNRTLYKKKKDGKYGFVDKYGKVIVDYIYDDATEQNEYGFSAIKKDGKWGSIDSKGNVIQDPLYNLDDYLLIDFIGRWHLGQDLNMNYYNQD